MNGSKHNPIACKYDYIQQQLTVLYCTHFFLLLSHTARVLKPSEHYTSTIKVYAQFLNPQFAFIITSQEKLQQKAHHITRQDRNRTEQSKAEQNKTNLTNIYSMYYILSYYS